MLTFNLIGQVIPGARRSLETDDHLMDLQLTGKRAFVSGSTQGIGYAIARALADEGATVTVNGRSHRRVLEAVERLQEEVPGAPVSGLAADF